MSRPKRGARRRSARVNARTDTAASSDGAGRSRLIAQLRESEGAASRRRREITPSAAKPAAISA
jgi:hypothetical protein